MPLTSVNSPPKVDPITAEVLRNALQEIAEEMAVALMRSAYSTNIVDRRDCSCAIYRSNGEPVAQSESGTPLHLGVMPAVVRSILKVIPIERMSPGDQFMMNTPYPEGPGHLNDLTLMAPVFHGEKVIALVANQAHHVDVGGMTPGSMPANATEVFQEGLQIPPVCIIRDQRIVDDMLSVFLANVRTPATTRGDLIAQAAANNVGRDRMISLAERWGEELIAAVVETLLNNAERRTRAAISALPRGTYRAKDRLDGPGDGLIIQVAITVDGDELTADFSGSSMQVAAPLNCRPATLLACLAFVVQAILDPGRQPNAGVLRPLKATAPLGTLMNARYPASVVHSNVVTTQRICDAILKAFHQIAPTQVVAACSGTQSLVCIGGYDPTRDEPFTYIETHGGGAGASASEDGQSAVHTHMTNTLNSPAEVLEQTFPFFVLEYGLRPDSAGPGEKRGGFGLRKRLRIDAASVLTVAADRMSSRPWGLNGGDFAASANVELERAGEIQRLPSRGTFQLEPGDILTLETPGGGGWGPARQRPRSQVARDVEDGLVSAEAAERSYGRRPD
jgi:N-methylhydantoinase B